MRRALGASAVILAVMLIRWLFGERIAKRLRYALWLFVPAYLGVSLFVSIPVGIPERTALPLQTSFAQVWSTAQGSGDTGLEEIRVPSEETEVPSSTSVPAGKHLPDPRKTAWGIRWGGTVAILVLVMAQNLHFAMLCRKQARFLGRDRETGMKICLIPGIASPFLLGSRIYLPTEILRDHRMRRHAVLHEYSHYRQGDAIWPMVRIVITALYWYNPLFWIACRLAAGDSELSCDEAVIACLGREHRVEYGETLIRMAERASKNQGGLILPARLGERGSVMKERIRSLAQGTKNSFPAALLSVAVAIAAAGCALAEPASVPAASKAGASWTVQGSTETGKEPVEGETALSESAEENPVREEDSDWYDPGDTGGSALFVGGKAYFSDQKGIHALDLSSGEQTDLVEEASWLGNINGGWLYYYKYTWMDQPYEDSGIYRRNLESGEEQKLLADDGSSGWNRWNIDTFCGEDGYLYVNLVNTSDDGLAAFPIRKDVSAASPLQQLLAAAGVDPARDQLCTGWIPTLLHTHKAVRILGEPGNCSLEILDADGGETVSVTEVFGNVCPSAAGLVYQTKDGNVHLLPWRAKAEQAELIFDAEQEGFSFNYGAADAVGVYGYGKDTDGKSYFYRVCFDGTVQKLQDVTELAAGGLLGHANLCGGNDWYSYCDFVSGDQVVRRID